VTLDAYVLKVLFLCVGFANFGNYSKRHPVFVNRVLVEICLARDPDPVKHLQVYGMVFENMTAMVLAVQAQVLQKVENSKGLQLDVFVRWFANVHMQGSVTSC
jgi:hypothetical protein